MKNKFFPAQAGCKATCFTEAKEKLLFQLVVAKPNQNISSHSITSTRPTKTVRRQPNSFQLKKNTSRFPKPAQSLMLTQDNYIILHEIFCHVQPAALSWLLLSKTKRIPVLITSLCRMWPSNLPDSTPFCENTIVCQSRNLFLGASFNDGFPSVFKTNPMVFGVGVFGCGSGPFCVVLLFPAGETHFVWFSFGF